MHEKYPCLQYMGMKRWEEESSLLWRIPTLCLHERDWYDKLVSMDGKYKHIQKNGWKCFHILFLLISLSLFLKGVIPFKLICKYMLNTDQYLSIGLVFIKLYTAFWVTINNLEILYKNKISDTLRGGMVEKRNILKIFL